jgi:serine/threonine protein phosphatase PrpC
MNQTPETPVSTMPGPDLARVIVREDAFGPERLETGDGLVVACSIRAPNKTTVNEDVAGVFFISAHQAVVMVADGVGGSNRGDRAAETIVRTMEGRLADAAQRDPPPQSLRTDVLDAIESANAEILSWGIGAAATVAAVKIQNGHIRSFHAGDSRVLLVSNRGRIKYSTICHSPTAMAIESGLLAEAEAMRHEHRHVITNCVGSHEMRIEIGPSVRLGRRDVLLVSSDGLFDNLSTDEVVRVICRGDLVASCHALRELVAARMTGERRPGKPDDLTFICYRQV